MSDAVDDLRRAIVERFAPAVIVLFGSVADGSDGPDSDVDLLVVLDDAPRDRRRSLMTALRKATRAVGRASRHRRDEPGRLHRQQGTGGRGLGTA